MPLADFVHLRVHTAYSLSAGAIRIKELAALCRAEAMPAVAITDTGNLFGALEFATACTDAGRPADHRLRDRARARRAEAAAGAGRGRAEPDRIVLLVQNETGYRNLMALVSRVLSRRRAPVRSRRYRSPISPRRASGLICLAGGAGGPIGRLPRRGPGATPPRRCCCARRGISRAGSISS